MPDNQEIKSITILGGGNFGTTLAHLCACNGHQVVLWVRSQEQASELNRFHTNKRYLGNAKISTRVHTTTNIDKATKNADVIYVAIPSTAFRSVIKLLPPLSKNCIIISTTKGIEKDSFSLMTDVIEEELPSLQWGALSGPNISREILNGSVSSTVIASHNPKVCRIVQQMLQSDYFRIYNSNDPRGVQLGGSLKNVYAIAAGIGSALNMGDNSKSMLITRALAEITRFSVVNGANPMTFLGLAGVGDLIVTCISPLSRNFQLGKAIGEGIPLDHAIERLGQVAEGINTLKLLKNQSEKDGIYMPIAMGLYKIIFEGHDIHELIRNSMLNEQKKDVEFD